MIPHASGGPLRLLCTLVVPVDPRAGPVSRHHNGADGSRLLTGSWVAVVVTGLPNNPRLLLALHFLAVDTPVASRSCCAAGGDSRCLLLCLCLCSVSVSALLPPILPVRYLFTAARQPPRNVI